MNVALAKIRWDRRSRDDMEDNEDGQPLTEAQVEAKLAQEEMTRQEEAQSRLVYDDESDMVDLGAQRATDMHHNQRLHLPQPRPPLEEAVLGMRLEVWISVSNKYIKEHCMPDGALKTHNLDTSERVGLSKLKKRVQAGEIVVLPADKGSQFTVSSQESYTRQGDTHTLLDRKIKDSELGLFQARMNSLSRGLAKVTGIGANWGDKNIARCWNNLTTDACIAPLLYPSPKVHKPADNLGDPKSRPIVQASSCVTSRPGEILADLLEAALLSYPEQQ